MKELKKWIATLAVLTVSCALIGCTDMLALREVGDTAFPDEIVLRAREADTIVDAEPEPPAGEPRVFVIGGNGSGNFPRNHTGNGICPGDRVER